MFSAHSNLLYNDDKYSNGTTLCTSLHYAYLDILTGVLTNSCQKIKMVGTVCCDNYFWKKIEKKMWFIGLVIRSELSIPQYWRTSSSRFCCYIYLQVTLHTYIGTWHIFFYYWVKRLERIGAEPRGGGSFLYSFLSYMAWEANLILELSKCQKLKPHLTNGWLTFE